MKSRTSSFNLTVFKKDLTRFAPAWAIYGIVLLLVLMAAVSDNEIYYRVNNVEAFVVVMAWINLFYGALVAQLLFGDLYNSRLCNALHAMPVTREGWFWTHTVSGLLFSLIPNLALALLAVPVLNLGAGWAAIPLWLLAACLQYLFFFGTAVLCVMLSGNRLGQLALYAIVQFAGLLAYWLASRIYEPLLYGIQINGEGFYPLCPAAAISQMGDIFHVDYERILNDMGEFSHYEVYGVAGDQGWGYMAICAAVGVIALGAALVLYRKRKLECAGDFVAFKVLEPVVLVLVTIFVGGFFHLCGDFLGGHACSGQFSGFQNQQTDAGGQVLGVDDIHIFQILGGHACVGIGYGETGTDGEADHGVALRSPLFHFLAVSKCSRCGGFGQFFGGIVVIIQIFRRYGNTVQIGVGTQRNRQGDDGDVVLGIELRGEITGTIGNNLYFFIHFTCVLSFFYATFIIIAQNHEKSKIIFLGL